MESLKTYRQNVGIDYGMGTTNRDMDTGIRYGVVSIHEVSQAWCDESEGNYFFGCPHCGTEFEPDFDILDNWYDAHYDGNRYLVLKKVSNFYRTYEWS